MNKIKRGFFSFSAVTRAGQHQAYNAWHMFDHIPENMALQGVMHGQRWVCPPEYQTQRLADDAALAPHQYMTLYLFEEPADKVTREFIDLAPRLEALGRFNHDRKSYLSGPFMLVKAYAAARVLVSPEAIPYRPGTGLFVTVDDVADASMEGSIGTWLDQVHVPDMLSVKHVAGIYWFRALHDERGGRSAVPMPAGRTVRVHYLDGDPAEMRADLKKKLPSWKRAGRYPAVADSFKPVLASLYQTIPSTSRFDWFDRKTAPRRK